MATFFLIWTLVTSFFGQNFRWLVRPHRLAARRSCSTRASRSSIPTIVAAVYFWRRRQGMAVSRDASGSRPTSSGSRSSGSATGYYSDAYFN